MTQNINNDVKRLNLVDIFIKWKKFIITFFVIFFTISIIISIILPQWYKSSAKILMPSSDGGLNIGSIMGNLPFDLNQSASGSLARMDAILKSRQLIDDVIEKYNLQDLYGNEYLFQTREQLLGNMSRELSLEENSILISVEYEESPDKAREMCQYILEKSNEIFGKVHSEEARNNRIFLEGLYNNAILKLESAEDSLKKFQKKYGTYILDEQVKATINNQAILEQKLVEARIEYQFLKNFIQKNSTKLKELRKTIEILENQLKKYQYKTDDFSVLIPLKSIPDKGIVYYKLTREISILSKVLEFLTPQYEQALIDENQSKPSFIVLDDPLLPEYKSRPKRSLVALGITFSAMLLLLTYIYIVEYAIFLKLNHPEKYNKYKRIIF